MAKDYTRFRPNYDDVPSLLSSMIDTKRKARPSTSQKITGFLDFFVKVADDMQGQKLQESLDKNMLDRSIELGNYRAEAREFEKLKEENEPLANNFKKMFGDYNSPEDKDEAFGETAYREIRKLNPEHFAAHPNLTWKKLKARQELFKNTPAADNPFYENTKELYTSMRDHIAEKVRLSQEFSMDEFKEHYNQMSDAVGTMGENIFGNSNALSKFSGSDARRLKLANAFIKSKMKNNIQVPLIEAREHLEEWKKSGEGLIPKRKNVENAELSYFNLLPKESLIPFKDQPSDLIDFANNEMADHILTYKEDNGLEGSKDLPPADWINERWLLTMYGTLTPTETTNYLRKMYLEDPMRKNALQDLSDEERNQKIKVAHFNFTSKVEEYSNLTVDEVKKQENFKNVIDTIEKTSENNRTSAEKELLMLAKLGRENPEMTENMLAVLTNSAMSKNLQARAIELANSGVELTEDSLRNSGLPGNRIKEFIDKNILYIPKPIPNANTIEHRKLGTTVDNSIAIVAGNPNVTLTKEEQRGLNIYRKVLTSKDSTAIVKIRDESVQSMWHAFNRIESSRHMVDQGANAEMLPVNYNMSINDPVFQEIYVREFLKGLTYQGNRNNKTVVPTNSSIEDIENMLIETTKRNRSQTTVTSITPLLVADKNGDFFIHEENSIIIEYGQATNQEELNNVGKDINREFRRLKKDRGKEAAVGTIVFIAESLRDKYGGKLKFDSETNLFDLPPIAEIEKEINPKSMDEIVNRDFINEARSASQIWDKQHKENIARKGRGYPLTLNSGETLLRIEMTNLLELNENISDTLEKLQKIKGSVQSSENSGKYFHSKKQIRIDRTTKKLDNYIEEYRKLENNKDLSDMIKTVNKYDTLGDEPSIDTSLKKKITNTPEVTSTEEETNLIDSVINSLIPTARAETEKTANTAKLYEATEKTAERRSPNELARIVLEAKRIKKARDELDITVSNENRRSPNALAKIVLEAKEYKDLSTEAKDLVNIITTPTKDNPPEVVNDSLLVPTKPEKEPKVDEDSLLVPTKRFIPPMYPNAKPKEKIESAKQLISDMSDEEMKRIDRELAIQKLMEKTNGFTKRNLTREEAIGFLNDAQFTVQDLNPDEFFDRIHNYSSGHPGQEDPLRILREIMDIPNLSEEEIESRMYLALLINADWVGLNPYYSKAPKTKEKLISHLKEVSLKKDKNIVTDKNRKDNNIRINSESWKQEMKNFKKKIESYTDEKLEQEFIRLRNETASQPVQSNEGIMLNLKGYTKLNMIYPERKAGTSSNESSQLIKEKLNFYKDRALSEDTQGLDSFKVLALKIAEDPKFDIRPYLSNNGDRPSWYNWGNK